MQEFISQDTYEGRLKWWNSSRHKLNKGLFFSGMTVIVVCGLIFELLMTHSSDNPRMSLGYFLFASVVYIFYFGTINLVFIVIEMLDRTFLESNNLKIRNTLFKFFFWLALSIPFFYPTFLLRLILLNEY